MRFHLILPGLLWPEQVLRDTARDLPLPSLSWLLGRSQLHWQDALALEDWLCREHGCDAGLDSAPIAALRLLGEGIDPGSAFWLCADPVHLHFSQGRPSLSGVALDITDAEMQQIVTGLAPLFAEVGEFRCGESGHAYLRLKALPQLYAPPPSTAIGRGSLLPTGADAARWARLGNEAQMLLHALPCNVEREAKGRPTLSSLWFWGAGSLPARKAYVTQAYAGIVGQQPLLKGLAAWAGIKHQATPAQLSGLLQNRVATQLLLDDLLTPMQRLETEAWRSALLAMERDWFQPLRKALASGRLESLRLTALGDGGCLDLKLSRVDALKLWRHPRPLHELTRMP